MANTKLIKGVLTLMPTPFDDNYKLDIDSFKDNVTYLESVGMHGIVVGSGAGEFYQLNDDEFRKLAIAAREACQNMICVLNCSYQSVKKTVERAKFAESIGIDCALVYPYHYTQKSADFITEYIRMVNEATNEIKIMLLNDPRETKSAKITVNMYTDLLNKYPRIAAIVEDIINSNEMDVIPLSVIYARFGERVSVLARTEAGMFPTMFLGGKGCLATYGLAMPKFLLKLYDECESKNHAAALQSYQTLTRYPMESNVVGVNIPGWANPLFPGTFTTPIGNTQVIAAIKVGTIFPGTPTTCKALAEAAGRKVGNPRPPLLPPNAAMKDFAKGWLADIGA